ncbi:MAG: glutamate--cysteine ligase [Actinomycetota bacterium]
MSGASELFSIGVEEEFFLIDPASRELSQSVNDVLARVKRSIGDQVEPELHLSQIEVGTEVCSSLGEVRAELVHLRGDLAAAAAATGLRIGAAGTHPFSEWRATEITPKEAYLRLERDYQQLAREQLVCGCHIHVGIPDPEAAIQVLNRVRCWLSPILALSVNSPFWFGVDSGYESYRTEVWRRWPMAGTPDPFASRRQYDELMETLLATGSIDDPARIYWDVRPSARFGTIEFRITDVCMSVDEAVMVAGLVRALAQTCHRQLQAGVPAVPPRSEVLRAATWRAARYGVQGSLIDVTGQRCRDAAQVIHDLLDFVAPVLTEHDELAEVTQSVQRTLEQGTGAARQRAAFTRRGSMEDVVDLIVEETLRGT